MTATTKLNSVWINDGPPISGAGGTASGADQGDILSDKTNGVLYVNSGSTPGSPSWSSVAGTAAVQPMALNAIGKVTVAATLKVGQWNTLTLTHGDACVLTVPDGRFLNDKMVVEATQDNVASYDGTITWGAKVKTAGGTMPTMTASTAAKDRTSLAWNGSVWIAVTDQAVA